MADVTAGPDRIGLTATREGAFSRGPAGGLAARRFEDHGMGRTSASAALAEYNAAGGALDKARLTLWMGGGALSLLLVAGVGIWGYKLVLREVLGVPVVQAEEGPMRVAPASPGGMVASHQGLSVNAVAAQEPTTAMSDVLLLAPPTSGLAPEDMEVVQSSAEADEVLPEGAATAAAPSEGAVTLTASVLPDRPMTPAEVLAFADSIAAGAAPLAAAAVDPLAQAVDPVAGTVVAALVPAEVPGVAVALRPPSRPGSALAAIAAVQGAAETEAPGAVALTDSIAAGTSLVQLGAFDSPQIAAAEWERLQGPFGEFLADKERVIQEAESGGRTFFRLRAMGFADLADARRLCAALTAEDAGCIPVVVR